MARPLRLLGPLLLPALLLLPLLAAPAAGSEPRTERWYERLLRGAKAGHLHVVWSPSTWEGRPTVRDQTTIVVVSTRSMAGIRDRFESTITVDLERAADGRLWQQRVRVEEGRRATDELVQWTGAGYHSESRLGEGEEIVDVALAEPVMTDAEAFLGEPIRRGDVAVGTTLTYAQLNVRGRKADPVDIEVLAREELEIEGFGPVACWKVVERHRASRAETLLWIDDEGALVRLLGEDGSEIRRATREAAEAVPTKTAEYGITVAGEPRLERVFGADRLLVTMHLQADPERKLPDLPDSPWSRAVAVRADPKKGTEIDVELRRHAGTGVSAPWPLERPADAPVTDADLEATVLMPVGHARLRDLATEIIGDAADARTAAFRLSRWVYANLVKRSPDVAQASALEILDQRCGDCSEHALLYVALCRAAGLPARRCSGYVCVGSLWGAHAWAEIWTGEWIAADPTTGEVAPGARYLFFGYPDSPDSFPGLVSNRIQGRLRLETRRIEEGRGAFDLGDPATHRRHEPEEGRFLHVLAGLQAREVPPEWSVTLSGAQRMRIRAPEFGVDVVAFATQGADLEELRQGGHGVVDTTFAGVPALLRSIGPRLLYQCVSRGRIVQLEVRGSGSEPVPAEALARLEYVLMPTFADPAPSYP